ncbi:alpha/beta fold hydrolase [Neobacillus niacini]|uniref:alpha/beta fold hydrolase n=1 Tax=Neobacillus niacini TaxID=86668 RepID=UPI002FFE719D
MSTQGSSNDFIPLFDVEKETKRWQQVYKIVTGPKPDIIPTPREVVWKKNKSILWYHPAKEKKYKIPLFFVYSLLNKSYILDIGEGSSVIGGLTQSGYDVYLLDWGSPGYEDSNLSIDNYVLDYLEVAVKRALRHSGVNEISLVGYCLGGTLAAILASITKLPIKNLVLSTIPIDFSIGIVPNKWQEALQSGQLSFDSIADVYGVIPADIMYAMFRGLSPIYISPIVNLITRAYDEDYVDKWRRMDKWTKDATPFSGAAFQQLFNDLFKENKLVKGELMIGGMEVDLHNIKCSLFVLSTSRDTLVLEPQSLPIMDLVSSVDKTYQVVEAGHVSLALTGKFAVFADKWLSSRSEELHPAIS